MAIGTEQLINQLGALSYVGIWITSFLANVVIPVPEEVILLALGYIIGTGTFNGLIILPIVISGLLLSDTAIYFLSFKGNRLVTWFYQKFFAQRVAKRGNAWIKTNIDKIIIFSRFLVQLRFLGPFIAGERKVAWKKFVVYDLFALVIYVPLYLLLGIYFHSKVKLIINQVGVVRNVILIAAGIIIVIALGKLAYQRVFKRNTTDNESTSV